MRDALRACEARALHTRGSRLRRFPPSENDCFAVFVFQKTIGFALAPNWLKVSYSVWMRHALY